MYTTQEDAIETLRKADVTLTKERKSLFRATEGMAAIRAATAAAKKKEGGPEHRPRLSETDINRMYKPLSHRTNFASRQRQLPRRDRGWIAPLACELFAKKKNALLAVSCLFFS